MIAVLNLTFYVTYVFLITTGSVTFIEALTTKRPEIRHILNIETVISIIAGFFYSRFVAMSSAVPNYSLITQTRYLDWSITTPFMLLSLCLALGFNIHQSVHLQTFLTIVFFNYGMLILGYLGERGILQKDIAMFTSFICFGVLFWIVYMAYLQDSNIYMNWIIFGLYVILWSIYGFVYKASDETKHTVYNVLDLFAKCFTGLFFWMYFAKIIVV